MRTVWLAGLGAFVSASGLFVSAGLSSDVGALRIDQAAVESEQVAEPDEETVADTSYEAPRVLADRAPDAPDPIASEPPPRLVLPPRDLPKLRLPGAVPIHATGPADPEVQARAMIDTVAAKLEGMLVRMEAAGSDRAVFMTINQQLKREMDGIKGEAERLQAAMNPQQTAAVEAYAKARMAPLMGRFMSAMTKNYNP